MMAAIIRVCAAAKTPARSDIRPAGVCNPLHNCPEKYREKIMEHAGGDLPVFNTYDCILDTQKAGGGRKTNSHGDVLRRPGAEMTGRRVEKESHV